MAKAVFMVIGNSVDLTDARPVQDDRLDALQGRELVLVASSLKVAHLRDVDTGAAPVVVCAPPDYQ